MRSRGAGLPAARSEAVAPVLTMLPARPRPQVLYLLDVVRSGVRTPNMRLTFTLALFIAKAALQLLKPGTAPLGQGRPGLGPAAASE